MPQTNTEGVTQRKSASNTAEPNGQPDPHPADEHIPSAFQTEWQAWMGSGPPPSDPAAQTLGAPKHGNAMQALRSIAFGIYFLSSCLFIHGAQLLGAPLYLVNKDWYYAWMALTKQYFGLLVTTMTAWWSPTTIRMSGDKSMAGLIKQGSDGLLQMELGERAVLMANHQIYTDWLYLWWIAYTNAPPTHGHIYIILKESLKYVPLIGPAMMFYGFIFMARKWAKDQERMRYRIQKLSTQHSGPMSGKEGGSSLDPMWLLIFPEGTNISGNTRQGSRKFSEKSGIPDMRHQLLPRSTGLQFCLQELHGTVEYLYDCTIGYEGIPTGTYGQDIFTLRSVYFQGRPPKSVNMHWRRYKVSEMPVDDKEAMSQWVLQRWREKDELLETFNKTGKFPGDKEAVLIEGAPQEKEWKTAYINTEVKPKTSGEFLQLFMPVTAAALVGRTPEIPTTENGTKLGEPTYLRDSLFNSTFTKGDEEQEIMLPRWSTGMSEALCQRMNAPKAMANHVRHGVEVAYKLFDLGGGYAEDSANAAIITEEVRDQKLKIDTDDGRIKIISPAEETLRAMILAVYNLVAGKAGNPVINDFGHGIGLTKHETLREAAQFLDEWYTNHANGAPLSSPPVERTIELFHDFQDRWVIPALQRDMWFTKVPEKHRREPLKETDGNKQTPKRGTKRSSTDGKSGEEPNSKTPKKNGGKEKPDPNHVYTASELSDIHLEGEETEETPIFETCNDIRRHLNDTLKHTTQANLARQLDAICPESNVSVRHLKKLLEFKGVQGGAHSPAFYAAYVYYEKIRIRQNKNKGKKRQTMEEIWGGKRANSAFLNWHSKGSRLGGFPREGQHKAAMFMSQGDNWSMNQYGQCVLMRRDGRVEVD